MNDLKRVEEFLDRIRKQSMHSITEKSQCSNKDLIKSFMNGYVTAIIEFCDEVERLKAEKGGDYETS